MKQTALEQKIEHIIQPVVKDLGFELVQVRLIGSQKLQTLQVLTEDPTSGRMDLDGCTAVSRAVSAILDVEDPIPGAYQLEVSSPGIDRPLIKADDFLKYVDFDISVETEIPQDSPSGGEPQKRFKGKLANFEDDTIYLATDSGDVEIALDNVAKAKLVLTEELVNEGQKKGQKKILNKKQPNVKAKQRK